MAYTHTSLATFKTALANRLGDVNKVYWTDTELGYYTIEALRTWGLLTSYWRDSGQIATTASTPFYDISTLTNSGGESLLSYAVTDSDVISIAQYHLLEPSTGTSWTGSEQFTLADLTGALTKRRNQLLVESNARITRTTQAFAAGSRFLDVPDTTLAIRRLAWIASDNTVYPLYPEDINSQRSYTQGFMITQGTPLTYSSASAQPLRYVIAPPSNQPGTMDMLVVQSGATLTAAGVALGVPDDMSWVIKWGVLADLLGKQGPGQDLGRSYFCERRYRLGIELAKQAAVVINAEINGVATSPDTVSQLDVYNQQWQSSTSTPEFVISLRNIIGLAPCPNGVFSVLLDVVRKAIVPGSPTDDAHQIQLGREYMDALLDYAEHLAAFKCGGQEFRITYKGATNFFNAAMLYNRKLGAQNPAIENLLQQSLDDDYVLPDQKDNSSRNRILDNVTPDA